MSGTRKLRYEMVVQVDGDASTHYDSRFIEGVIENELSVAEPRLEVDVRPAGGSMSEDYPFTSMEYWHSVMYDAEENLEKNEEVTERAGAHEAAEYAVESERFVDFYPRATIYHCRNGMGGDGYERFVNNSQPEDERDMLRALAAAAYYNDVYDVAERIIEAEQNLGEAVNLIDGNIWDEGFQALFKYEKGLQDPEVRPYMLRHLGGGEWAMSDPNHKQFEVISPDVHVDGPFTRDGAYNFDYSPAVLQLETWLNNICAKRERELENRAEN
jgi:hypothetical protein